MEALSAAFVYLVAAVVAVPIAKRLGLGSVLGYLLAGIAIGPVLGFVGAEATKIQHFAEFGVVMMLFLVGLELQPAVLWKMRRQLLGLGGLQVVGTTLLIGAAAAVGFDFSWQASLAIGMIFALSSTAIVLQTLNEKGWMKTIGGQSTFSVLLTQDIAVIPMLALMPLLAVEGSVQAEAAQHGPSLIEGLPGWGQALASIGAIAFIVVVVPFLRRPLFQFIAAAKLREIFTAAALMLVIGIALLMHLVGLSPALGTFIAGVVLSDSDYRHEIEADIEPFKGLLLGLFFLTVGAAMDFGLFAQQPGLILGLAVGLIVLKLGLLYVLATGFGLRGANRALFTLGLAQAGEFAFVLFGVALAAGILEAAVVDLLTLVVAVTMILTPGLFILYERVLAPRATHPEREPDEVDTTGCIVVAGMGRFGQIVTRMLMTNGYACVLLDHDPTTVENVADVGMPTYYGDATRPELLHAAGIEEAALFVAALDDRDKQNKLVHHVAKTYPHVKILARARDRHHVYELENAGAHVVERELFEGSIALGTAALRALGKHPYRAETRARTFRKHDLEMLDALRDEWNAGGVTEGYVENMRAHAEALHDIMEIDRHDQHDRSERGWTPPPKGGSRLSE